MNVIYFMLPLALILGALFVALFIWATKSGQYDDLDTPSKRMLFDEININNKEKRERHEH